MKSEATKISPNKEIKAELKVGNKNERN